jgi:hypothetical protein
MADAVQTKGRSAAPIEVLVDCSLQTSEGAEAATPYPLACGAEEQTLDAYERRNCVVVDDSLNNPGG